MPWRTIDGKEIAPKGKPELDVLIKGIFEKARFLDLIKHFIVFESDGAMVAMKMAAKCLRSKPSPTNCAAATRICAAPLSRTARLARRSAAGV